MVTGRLLNLANFNQHLFMHESCQCRCVLRTKACLISAAELHEENPEKLVQIQQPRLRVTEVTNQNLVKLLYSEIDRGEAEAIALALESHAELILLDDAEAREKARLYGLTMTGVICVLLQAKKAGKLSVLSEALATLIETGFWLNHTLRDRLLAEAGEANYDK